MKNINIITFNVLGQHLNFITQTTDLFLRQEEITKCYQEARDTSSKDIGKFISLFTSKMSDLGIEISYVEESHYLNLNIPPMKSKLKAPVWDCKDCIHRYCNFTNSPCNDCVNPMGKNFQKTQ